MFDHQEVKLIGITKPRIKARSVPELKEIIKENDEFLQQEFGYCDLINQGQYTLPDPSISANDFIAYCARISNPENQNNTQTAEKLVKYLIKNKHWSPFEMVHIVMEIKTTRDMTRQILRHRSFSFQEFSTRYAEAMEMISNREARIQDPKNRQNSISDPEALASEMTGGVITKQELFERYQISITKYAKAVYEILLKQGIAKEQARSILPEGLTLSTLYMAGTLRSWIHYIDLRSGNGSQKEHQDIAIKCKKLIEVEFPCLKDYFSEKSS